MGDQEDDDPNSGLDCMEMQPILYDTHDDCTIQTGGRSRGLNSLAGKIFVDFTRQLLDQHSCSRLHVALANRERKEVALS